MTVMNSISEPTPPSRQSNVRSVASWMAAPFLKRRKSLMIGHDDQPGFIRTRLRAFRFLDI